MDQRVPLPADGIRLFTRRRDGRAGALRSIQYLRALAAFMVVAYHTSHYLEDYRSAHPLAG